ncbi:MAG TPA: serine hydrolase domain-containing protein [Saprospiraceae bacterium]|nr:serine hydrolase domain-containing protein [Saprospiraceae bacterium]
MKQLHSLLALLLLCSQLSSQSAYPPETLAKIREIENNITGNLILNNARPNTIAEQMAKYKVNGMSIAVIHNYQIAWAKGYGWADVAEQKPMTAETLFEPGSISKTLNAVGILKLAQDKKVDLYTDINQYLKSWKFPYDSLSKGKKINLAQLLSHQAGLTVHGFPGHDINGPIPTVYEVLDGKEPSFTPAVRSAFEPDLYFQYSGGGTTISQVLLSDVTGQAYDVWMYENVLKPIGMVNSTYAQPPAREKWPLCSSAYHGDGTPIERKFHVYPEQAAAGLWMTPSDLCQYIIDMQLAWKGKPSRVLSPEMVKLHLTPYNNGPAAMGTFIEDHDGMVYFQHGAGNDGFCGQFFGSMEDGYGVAIFLNSDNGRLLGEVINSVAKAYNWKNFYREPRKVESITVPKETLKSYEGLYLFDDTWAAIGQKDGEFHFYTDGTFAKMYFTTPTQFINEEFQAVKTMIKDANGQITGYNRHVNGKEFPSSRKITNLDAEQLSGQNIMGIGWYYSNNKQYRESLSTFKRGIQLYPEDLNMHMNAAHLYLYNNDYPNAIAIYKAHLNDMIRPGYSWIDSLKDDYKYFKNDKNDVTLFDKVFAELKIEKPN